MPSTPKKKATRTAASKRVPSPAPAPGKRRSTTTARRSGTSQVRSPAPDPTEEHSPSPGESLAGAFGNIESNLTRQPDECAERPAKAASAPTVAEGASDAGGACQAAPAHVERPATKRALIISMLQRPHGASLFQLTAATGWLPHTARAALTGLRHKGFVLEKSKNAQRVTVYRIAESAIDSTDSKSTKLKGLSPGGRGADELSSALPSADAPGSCSFPEEFTSSAAATSAGSGACASTSEEAA